MVDLKIDLGRISTDISLTTTSPVTLCNNDYSIE